MRLRNLKIYLVILYPPPLVLTMMGMTTLGISPNFKPNAEIFVYTLYGELIYKSQEEYIPWNGTYNGKEVPIGKYYYVIDVGKGLRNPDGWIILKR